MMLVCLCLFFFSVRIGQVVFLLGRLSLIFRCWFMVMLKWVFVSGWMLWLLIVISCFVIVFVLI